MSWQPICQVIFSEFYDLFCNSLIFIYIKNSKKEISKLGHKKFIEQGQNISFFLSLFRESHLKELYKILMPEMRSRLYALCSEKGAALYAVIYYLHDIKIKWENDDLIINQSVNFTDIDDIRKWYKKTKVKDIKLLEKIDDHRKIIDEIKAKAEELRKYLLDTFDINELISYSSK